MLRQKRRRGSWNSSSIRTFLRSSPGRKRLRAKERAGRFEVHDGGTAMTLRNRLYMNFGAVLVMVLVMFLVNYRAVSREHEAKDAATSSLALKDATDAVKSQMMQNRLYLSNYLLSGDTREVDKMNDGIRVLNDKLEKTQGLANSEQEKTALEK